MEITLAVVKRPHGNSRKFSLRVSHNEIETANKYGVNFNNECGVYDYISPQDIARKINSNEFEVVTTQGIVTHMILSL